MNEQSGSDTDTLENSQSDDRSQQAVQQAMEYPLEQTIRVQKGAAQLLLSGLEMGTKAQSRSVQLTKDVFDSYITTLERAAQDTEQLTQTATARIQSQGEAMQQEGQQAVSQAMRMGAEGIRLRAAGRLGGAEMGRVEQYLEGRVPLHTMRADIDYAQVTAYTIYGTIGVKAWICRGEIIGKPDLRPNVQAQQKQQRHKRRSARQRAESNR
ncbi:MAG: hypothetical protein BRD45_01805 [Bacteroidetes bacterium QS_8_64_10]|nr:MAG: hypothetical protein BRD45_01805 [Bacteroidetes bacterium QS_8_64_10]